MLRTPSVIGGLLRRPAARVVSVLVACVLVLSGCGGGSSAKDTSGLKTVTLAMDYLPSSTHGGLAYAMQSGLFAKEGIKVKLISYNGSTTGEPIVTSGKADLAIGQNNAIDTNLFASGAPVKSIFIIAPGNSTHISVLKSSGIISPAGLVGKIYGGYGSPFEEALVNQMIKTSGGNGKVKQVVLNVGSYEALKAKKVATIVTYPEDEYRFAQENVAIVKFKPTAFGVPAPVMAGAMILANDSFLTKHPDLARGFTKALQEGYEKAIADPAATTKALLAQFPESNINSKLALATAEVYAKGSFPNPDGSVGTQSVEQTQLTADWMAKRGLLVDSKGKTLSKFDVTTYVTNDYLPK